MEKTEMEIGKPIIVGQITLIPVITFSLNGWSWGSRFFCFGIKQPVYIVAVSPSGKQVFNTDGEEVPFGKFIKETPGLEEVLVQIKEEPSRVVKLPDSEG